MFGKNKQIRYLCPQFNIVLTNTELEIMKKFMIMAAFVLSSVGAFAQHAVGTVTLQPKIGLNCSSLTGDGYDYKAGFVGGAELEYQICDKVGLSGGLLYSMQGANFKDADDAKIKLDYINIPILANIYVTKGLAVKAGIQPAFNVNKEVSYKNNSTDLEDGIKSFDFSIPVGISYEYANFVLDARYNIGLTKVYDDVNISGIKISNDSKNSVFQLTIGYKFVL